MHPLERAQEIFQQTQTQMPELSLTDEGAIVMAPSLPIISSMDAEIAAISKDDKGRSVILLRGLSENNAFTMSYVAHGDTQWQRGDVLPSGAHLFDTVDGDVEIELRHGFDLIRPETALAYVPGQEHMTALERSGIDVEKAKIRLDRLLSPSERIVEQAATSKTSGRLNEVSMLTQLIDPLGMTEEQRAASDLVTLEDSKIYHGFSQIGSELGACDFGDITQIEVPQELALQHRNLLMQAARSISEDGHVSDDEIDKYYDLICHITQEAVGAGQSYAAVDIGEISNVMPPKHTPPQAERVPNPLPQK